MTTLELKTAIHKAIDNAPESRLPEILDHIKSIAESSAQKEKLDGFFEQIVREDDDLLKRLADS